MSGENAVRFVGLYASFPIEKKNRRVGILQEILALEDSPLSGKIKYGQTVGKIRTEKNTAALMSETIHSLSQGELDWFQLIPQQDTNWRESYQNTIHLTWASSIINPHRRPVSPVEARFGPAGSLVISYPLSRFTTNSESPFQRELMSLVERLFIEEKMYWAFLHMGHRPVKPSSIGTDEVFSETRGGFPLTSFDSDLDTTLGFFKEFVKGAFWANFLSQSHVEKLGGLDKILNERPCRIIKELGGNRVLLQVDMSPIPHSGPEVAHDYQRLRVFLKPILLETVEDRQKLQENVVGSWRPPGVGIDWKPTRCRNSLG